MLYFPSYMKYQLDHPPVTIHLTKKIEENFDVVKNNRLYAEIISKIL